MLRRSKLPGRADGRLAVIAQPFDRLVEELGLVFPAGGGVTPPQSGQNLWLGFGAHVGVPRG
jgi:hypothetical protein